MKGAREYAKLFKTGQYDKLYIESDYHARGRTFRIYIMNIEGKKVEVYGVVSGTLGWTDEYGWLYEGAWQDDFKTLLQTRKLEVALDEKKKQAEKLKDQLKRVKEDKKILDSY